MFQRSKIPPATELNLNDIRRVISSKVHFQALLGFISKILGGAMYYVCCSFSTLWLAPRKICHLPFLIFWKLKRHDRRFSIPRIIIKNL